jgi:hypothetical protein
MCSQPGHRSQSPAGISFRGFSEKPFHFDFACLPMSTYTYLAFDAGSFHGDIRLYSLRILPETIHSCHKNYSQASRMGACHDSRWIYHAARGLFCHNCSHSLFSQAIRNASIAEEPVLLHIMPDCLSRLPTTHLHAPSTAPEPIS